MKMKKSCYVLSLAAIGLGATLLVGQATFAQDATNDKPQVKTHERKQRTGIPKIYEQLNLTDEQKTALQPIFDDMRTKTQALHDNKDLTPQQRREQMKQIRTDADTKINAILTEEQRTKLAEIREQAKANRKQHAENKTPDAPAPDAPAADAQN
jgi:Spy/CpxP family protein refolding chaperone